MRRVCIVILFNLLCVVYCSAQTVQDDQFAGPYQLVPVETTTIHSSDSAYLPEFLNVRMTVFDTRLHIKMMRNRYLNLQTPVTFENQDESSIGESEIPNIGLYQNAKYSAAISVTAKLVDNNVVRTLEGNFAIDDVHYAIVSSPGKVLWGGPILHKVYRLQDMSGPQSKTTMNISDFFAQAPSQAEKDTWGDYIYTYVVEIVFILDHTIWEYYMKRSKNVEANALVEIKYYFTHILNGIDVAFKSIDSNVWSYTITPILKSFHIAKTAKDSTWTVLSKVQNGVAYSQTTVDSDQVLQRLGVWKTQEGRSWKNPDHAMLWTRYELVEKSPTDQTLTRLRGKTRTGGVCLPTKSVSVVKEDGLNAWYSAAHELAHNLGAEHDGVGNSSCPLGESFIMKPNNALTTKQKIGNVFRFSNCSIKAMKILMEGGGPGQVFYPRVCLTNRVCSNGVSMSNKKLPGQIYSLDEQCRLRYDSGSIGKTALNADGDVCFRLYCVNAQKTTYAYQSPGAADGTPCGVNKCCLRGFCVSDCASKPAAALNNCSDTRLSSSIPASCSKTSGKLATPIRGQKLTCQQVTQVAPELCFSDYKIGRICCRECSLAGLVFPTQHKIKVKVVEGFRLQSGRSTFTPWSPYGACSVTCGVGKKKRTRICESPAQAVADCDGPLVQWKKCGRPRCPVDGKWSRWSTYSACSVTCGNGKQTRQRRCIPPKFSGKSCRGPYTQTRKCRMGRCSQSLVVFRSKCNTAPCIRSCKNRAYAHYQQCGNCHHYVTCSRNGLLRDRQCPSGFLWDDNAKRCLWWSTTCTCL